MKKAIIGWIALVTICLLITPYPSRADEWGMITIPAGDPLKIGLAAMILQ